MIKADNRFILVLKEKAGSKPPSQEPLPGNQETPNPAPDKDYSDTQQPFTDGDEYDPEIDDE